MSPLDRLTPLVPKGIVAPPTSPAGVAQPALEVADIFRGHGAAWHDANRGRVSLDQLKVMSAIESCRTAALGGHVARCADCAHTVIAYNSCRNRHCPRCQGVAARAWMAAREAELLPVSYFHVVFTLPSAIGDIAYHNKAVIYDLVFTVSAETMLTIAADPKHLGARIGFTSVLHRWGSAMTHHPHVHMIVPGGGLARDGSRWIPCKPNFCLPVRVLSKLFRRLMRRRCAEHTSPKRMAHKGRSAFQPSKSPIAARLDAIQEVQKIGLQVHFVIYRRDAVDAGSTVLAGQPIGLRHPSQIDDVVQRAQRDPPFRPRQIGYPLSVCRQACGVQGPPCVRSTVLYSWPPPSLRRVPASPVPRLPRYDEGATTSRRANPLAYGFGYGFHASLLCSCSPERS